MTKTNDENLAKTDYDKANYDYQTYWEGRFYENMVEQDYLDSLLPYYSARNKIIVDVGGSFGRLDDTTSKYFKKRIILDYSLLNLQNCKSDAILVQADAYAMPFLDSVVDLILTVRVSHHLQDQAKFLQEVYRVLSLDGIFVYEVANKFHFKAILKNMFRLNFKFFKKEPIQQTAGAGKTFFQNYPISYILDIARNAGFELIEKRSIENFRSGPKGFSQKRPEFWMKLDKVLSFFFDSLNFGPSIYLVLRKTNDKKEVVDKEVDLDIAEIFKTEPKNVEGRVLVYT
ncbi:class I SAM-dependent methyltransferase [bacterium]|nr:MAG: class I SAM-dependent methyltransferase [bacterium]